MKLVYSEKYHIDIGAHVFPTRKYQLIKHRLIDEHFASEDDFFEPHPARDSDVLLAHTREYIKKLKEGALTPQEESDLEIPYSEEAVESSWICAGGTIEACRNALEFGVGVHVGGGFHHAYPDHGEGFCVLNDMAIGIKKMQREKLIKKAAVIDCDLHQGNGTAAIFNKSKSVFTFSIHQEANYPVPKEESSLDIGLPDAVEDGEYLEHLQKAVPDILDGFKPQLVVYLAGADPFEFDQLGGLSLTINGLKTRDQYVLSECRARNIPVATVFGGGYAYNVEDTVTIHVNTIKAAMKLIRK